jgi:hypothetical protein
MQCLVTYRGMKTSAPSRWTDTTFGGWGRKRNMHPPLVFANANLVGIDWLLPIRGLPVYKDGLLAETRRLRASPTL